ncbi:response regulator transcription factor [Lentzea sp. BCCO 10_0061]|uniref:Response regulator transcription factor n=1 Tax=Lentzea sokolovensis TaxID=3095429 RepID=A0ABU4V174_9PSEU|nr:response regulator transcription factor [Lentzea sp. BCCO 10_0061]MDX8145009.1 response regulator transcription factor [Lentzea sp. BCCO 10_0061]
MITTGAIDDHPMMLHGLRAYLAEHAPDVRLATVCPSVSALLEVQPVPAVVLLDLLLPDNEPVEDNVRRLRDAGAQVVVYTSESRPGYVHLALKAGAVGLVLKGDPEERLVEAIRAAAEGQSSCSSRLAHAIMEDRRAFIKFSQQERDVLSLIAKGLPHRLVAKELGISEKTVPTYLNRARERYRDALDIPVPPSPGETIAFALEDGHIELPYRHRQ